MKKKRKKKMYEMFLNNTKSIYQISVKIRSFSLGRLPPTKIDDSPLNGKKKLIRKYQAVDVINSRTFLQFPGFIQGMKKEYEGKKLVGYSMEQMFDVVADVENYNKFVPFCKKSLVTSRTSHHLRADLIIGFPPIVESYTSNVTLVRPNLVKAVCTDGKLFHHLLTLWKFSPGLKNNTQTCIIDFFVTFEFRSSLHSQLAHMFFNELVRQMESAFYREAKARYGKPTLKVLQLNVQNKES